MISWSGLASPGGSIAFHFHWIQRAELTNDPSFSAKFAAGSRNTSVWTSSALLPTSAWMSSRQKAAVSCSKFSATTSHFSFDSAAIALRECGPLLTGFIPKLKKPSISPRYIRSKM
jgi:hypothetical protein